jgi:hypothetical protein
VTVGWPHEVYLAGCHYFSDDFLRDCANFFL